MKERPIIFSTPMVRAILEDRKTMTRRVIKPQPKEGENCLIFSKRLKKVKDTIYQKETKISKLEIKQKYHPYLLYEGFCLYGQPGDKLWVRETYSMSGNGAFYKTDADDTIHIAWIPAIFMSRKHSRLTLEITNIRVERLQEINEGDAKMEGVMPYECSHQTLTGRPLKSTYHYKKSFVKLWNSINNKTHPWSSNPWVWCISFKKI